MNVYAIKYSSVGRYPKSQTFVSIHWKRQHLFFNNFVWLTIAYNNKINDAHFFLVSPQHWNNQ